MNSRTDTKPKRIISIQVCRGLAAAVVVLAHLYNVELKYCHTQHMRIFQYGVLGVDLFFVISGVVIASVSFGKFGDPSYTGTFAFHRFARIFPIYWVYTTIILVAYLYNPNWINAGSGHSANILASYLLIPTHRSMLIMQAWTLSFEIYFYLAVCLLLLIGSQRSMPWMLTTWGLVVAGTATLFPRSTQPLLQFLFNPLVLEFLAGFAIFYIYRKARLHPTFGVLLVCMALMWLAVVIAYNARFHHWDGPLIETGRWTRPALYGVFSALLLLGAIELERTGLVRYFRFLEAIGDWSYSIYLSHIIVIELVGRTGYHFAPGIHGLIFLIDLISIPLVLLVGQLSYTYLEKPLMSMLYKRPTHIASNPSSALN